jgi:hypothetical protein
MKKKYTQGIRVNQEKPKVFRIQNHKKFLSRLSFSLLVVEATNTFYDIKDGKESFKLLVPNNWSIMPKFLVYPAPLNNLPPLKCYASSIFYLKIMES